MPVTYLYNTTLGESSKDHFSSSAIDARYHNVLRIDVSYDMYMHGTFIRTNHKTLDFGNTLIDSDGAVSLNYADGTQITIYESRYSVV